MIRREYEELAADDWIYQLDGWQIAGSAGAVLAIRGGEGGPLPEQKIAAMRRWLAAPLSEQYYSMPALRRWLLADGVYWGGMHGIVLDRSYLARYLAPLEGLPGYRCIMEDREGPLILGGEQWRIVVMGLRDPPDGAPRFEPVTAVAGIPWIERWRCALHDDLDAAFAALESSCEIGQ